MKYVAVELTKTRSVVSSSSAPKHPQNPMTKSTAPMTMREMAGLARRLLMLIKAYTACVNPVKLLPIN